MDKHSAVLDTAWETQIAVDADHRNMCKFLSREDRTYQSCSENIKQALSDHYDLEQEACAYRCLDPSLRTYIENQSQSEVVTNIG